MPPGQPGVFVRGGSLLTLDNAALFHGRAPIGFTLAEYAGASGQWALMEDDGISNAYRQGVLAEIRFAVAPHANGRAVQIARRQGLFQPPLRTLTFLPRPPRGFRFDGGG